MNVAVAVAMHFQALPWTAVDNLIEHGASFGPKYDEGEYYRFVAAMFLHGGLLHLSVNLFGLYMLGSFVERSLGKVRFSILYFASGISGSIASACISPDVPSVGASGALFGLLGCVFGVSWRGRHDPDEDVRVIFRSIRRQAGFWILLNIVLGLSIPQIDNAAHMGGLGAGALYGVFQVRGGTRRDQFRRSLVPFAVIFLLALSSFVALFPWGIGDLSKELEDVAALEGDLNTAAELAPRGIFEADPADLRIVADQYTEFSKVLAERENDASISLRRFVGRAKDFAVARADYFEGLALLIRDDVEIRKKIGAILDRHTDAHRKLRGLGPTVAIHVRVRQRGDERGGEDGPK